MSSKMRRYLIRSVQTVLFRKNYILIIRFYLKESGGNKFEKGEK